MNKQKIPFARKMENYVKSIEYQQIAGINPVGTISTINSNVVKVNLKFSFPKDVTQDDWQVNIVPSFTPDFHWAPHLTPTDENIIDQHSFRSPSLIVSDLNKLLIVIPDLEIMNRGTSVRWYLDLNALKNNLTLGMSDYLVAEHVLYKRKPGAIYPKGGLEIGFYLMMFDDQETIFNPFRPVLQFLWENWGGSLYDAGLPLKGKLDHYVEHTYKWAFDRWEKNVWQEFELNGKRVGAPVFIVNVTQSPNYKGHVNEREFRSIWNQAWFSSLRSASGLYRYAKETNNSRLLHKALLTKELTLSAPKKNGFFPAVIATEMEEMVVNGEKVNLSKGWETFYWGNSNRNPFTRDTKHAPFHVLDMSWTALLMLRWYEDLEHDERLLFYAIDYAEALLKKQDPDGYFPGWLNTDTLEPLGILDQSPETSLSITFLLKLYEITKEEKYKQAALKAMEVICKEVMMVGRWEDFETYWSCSSYGNKSLVGNKVLRNNMYKQCNFSIFWTAEALLECYQITGNEHYLKYGTRCLDELLMTQASWQPQFLHVDTLGGFGVMNADGEWNDSRQSLFAELIVQYGIVLGQKEYIQRGLAALRSAFTMMYCPENTKTKLQWEKKWPFFNESDYGFMMENYGHDGKVDANGLGIGEFTIYDWGNGAAAESYLRMKHHFRENFLEEQ